MQIKYILNQIQKHKGFIYGQARFIKNKTRSVLEIDIHREHSRFLNVYEGKQRQNVFGFWPIPAW